MRNRQRTHTILNVDKKIISASQNNNVLISNNASNNLNQVNLNIIKVKKIFCKN
jgi:hypothetical protein